MFELQVGGVCYSQRLPPPRWLGGEFSIVKHARRLCGALEKDL
jgi:hypothetical protein